MTQEYTKEIADKLGMPVPEHHIGHKIKGGVDLRFTSDKWVFSRLNEVVGAGGWEDRYVVNEASVTCSLTVLGVTKSSSADFEEGKYGGPVERATAKALKRAAMKFGIAAELWEKEEHASAPAQRGAASGAGSRGKPATRGAGARGGAVTTKFPGSDKQRGVLVKSGLPDDFIDRLTMGDLRNEIIGAMMKARTNNATDAIKAALEVVTDQTYELLAPLYGAGTGGDGLLDDEDDSPYDDDDEA